NNDGALYCLGQVIDVIHRQGAQPEQPAQYLVKILFRRIRDEDRDMVVRASLHENNDGALYCLGQVIDVIHRQGAQPEQPAQYLVKI
ncbi:hypothetical protein, partial [Escherichia coli]|uniref:hypothetical protein n=1 Tax=Escherichia coli TaxID=562 RepID=UPI001BC89376